MSLASTIYNRHLETQEFANCQAWVQFSRESNDLRDNHMQNPVSITLHTHMGRITYIEHSTAISFTVHSINTALYPVNILQVNPLS